MPGQAAKTTLYTVPAGAGFVAILCTTLCRRAEIIEDDSVAAPTGLDYKLPNDNFTAQFTVSAAHEPIVLGNPLSSGMASGQVLGNGPDASGGYTIAATPLINVRTKGGGAGATTVRVTEFN